MEQLPISERRCIQKNCFWNFQQPSSNKRVQSATMFATRKTMSYSFWRSRHWQPRLLLQQTYRLGHPVTCFYYKQKFLNCPINIWFSIFIDHVSSWKKKKSQIFLWFYFLNVKITPKFGVPQVETSEKPCFSISLHFSSISLALFEMFAVFLIISVLYIFPSLN